MSEHAVADQASTVPENPFTREELSQFDHDDTSAGRAIGKLLAIIFFYTIIAMSIAAAWTFSRI